MSRIIFFTLINLAAFFVLARLWPRFRASHWRWAFIGLTLLAISGWALPVLLGKGMHGTVPRVGVPLKLFGSAWLMSSLILTLGGLLFMLADALVHRFLPPGAGRDAPVPPASNGVGGVSGPGGIDMGRRRLLTGIGRAVPVAAMATGAGGVLNGSSGFVLRREEVRVRGLPQALDGFKIGQITDVHVGPFIDADYVRQAVAAMNDAQADLQVVTGDLIDDLEQLDETMAALEGCRAPHGMLAVLGNHEHWRGLSAIKKAYRASAQRSSLRLLVDEAHVLEHAGQKVRVVGVDYPIGSRTPSGKQELMKRSADKAFGGTAQDEVVLCLTHHPDFFPYAAEKGARLTLAGHTHGGQVAFFGIPAFGFAFKHMLGRYRRNDHHLYVSGGTGHWLPFRVGVPAEVTLLTLRSA